MHSVVRSSWWCGLAWFVVVAIGCSPVPGEPALREVSPGQLFDVGQAEQIGFSTPSQRSSFAVLTAADQRVVSVPFAASATSPTTIEVELSTGARARWLVVVPAPGGTPPGTDLVRLADALVAALWTMRDGATDVDRAALAPFITQAEEAALELGRRVEAARASPLVLGTAKGRTLSLSVAALEHGDAVARGVLAGTQPFGDAKRPAAAPMIVIGLAVVAVAYLANYVAFNAEELAAKADKAQMDVDRAVAAAKQAAADAADGARAAMDRVLFAASTAAFTLTAAR